MTMWRQVLEPGVLSLGRTGSERFLVTQHAMPNQRPYLHPLLTPSESQTVTEDRPPHHPWQHGLYVGLNQVNGIGFWTEGEADGTFHPEPLRAARVVGDQASWEIRSEWRTPEGAPVLSERQAWVLADGDGGYRLDLTWSLTALTSIAFGRHAYGGLFLRMPYHKERPAAAVDSEGRADQAGEGQRARWVCVGMALAETGEWGSVAILDHPSNPSHPVPWRIDGQFGIGPSRCIAGPWQLDEGDTAMERYRVLVSDGQPDPVRTEAAWRAWAEQG